MKTNRITVRVVLEKLVDDYMRDNIIKTSSGNLYLIVEGNIYRLDYIDGEVNVYYFYSPNNERICDIEDASILATYNSSTIQLYSEISLQEFKDIGECLNTL